MDRYTIKLIYYDIQSTSEKAAIKNCLIAHDDSGEWVRYEDAAARIAELEAQLAAMQRIIDSYKDDIRADTPTEKEVFNSAANAWHRKAIEDSNKIITMEKELEVERMRLALCGGAADANTRTMATERINKDNPYYSSSYERVCDAVDREMDLREQLAAAQERNVALQSEHLNHVNALHEKLTAMTDERDSESRWAKHYSDKVTELEQQLAAKQRIIDSYRRMI